MSMALALARASELNDNQPELKKEESILEIPITNAIAKKINIASGEDVPFEVDQDEAWAWHDHMNSNVRNPNVY